MKLSLYSPQIPSQNRIRCLQKRNVVEKSMGKTISQAHPSIVHCQWNFKQFFPPYSMRNFNNFQLKLKREKRFVSLRIDCFVALIIQSVKWTKASEEFSVLYSRLSIIRIKCSVSKRRLFVAFERSLYTPAFFCFSQFNIELQLRPTLINRDEWKEM